MIGSKATGIGTGTYYAACVAKVAPHTPAYPEIATKACEYAAEPY